MHCIHFAMLQTSTGLFLRNTRNFFFFNFVFFIVFFSGVPVSINVFNNKKYSKVSIVLYCISPRHCVETNVIILLLLTHTWNKTQSFIGKEAETWIRANVRGCDPAKAIEILKKLVRGRCTLAVVTFLFLCRSQPSLFAVVLQIDYKEALRPYDSLEIYRLNPKVSL